MQNATNKISFSGLLLLNSMKRLQRMSSSYKMPNVVIEAQVASDVSDHRLTNRVQIPSNDITIMHEAIPFLPVPVALLCLFFNVIIPGSGKFI